MDQNPVSCALSGQKLTFPELPCWEWLPLPGRISLNHGSRKVMPAGTGSTLHVGGVNLSRLFPIYTYTPSLHLRPKHASPTLSPRKESNGFPLGSLPEFMDLKLVHSNLSYFEQRSPTPSLQISHRSPRVVYVSGACACSTFSGGTSALRAWREQETLDSVVLVESLRV